MSELTKAEGELVLRLLELYDAAWENSHARQCECTLCEATERSGGFNVSTFEALKRKAEAALVNQ